MKTHPSLLDGLLALSALAVGCNCRGAGTGGSFADLGVVWKDTDGSERVDRDALDHEDGGLSAGNEVPLFVKDPVVGKPLFVVERD